MLNSVEQELKFGFSWTRCKHF